MDMDQTIKGRRSIRRYLPKDVPDEHGDPHLHVLGRVLEHKGLLRNLGAYRGDVLIVEARVDVTSDKGCLADCSIT